MWYDIICVPIVELYAKNGTMEHHLVAPKRAKTMGGALATAHSALSVTYDVCFATDSIFCTTLL